MPAKGHPLVQSTPTDLRRAVRAAEAKIHGHGPELVQPREYEPVCERPVWEPMKDRAFRVAMEKIDINKRVATLGRK